MSSVAVKNRFRRGFACPICGGHRDLQHGQGLRCTGYMSADGEYIHCTREDHPNNRAIEPTDASEPTYAHRARGECRCGKRHDGSWSAAKPARRMTPVTTRYELRDEAGNVVGVHARKDFLDSAGKPYREKQVWWERHQERGPKAMPLYGLPELLAAPGETRVYVTEGEKARDSLVRAGLLAVGTVTGAATVPGDDALRPLVGHDVILWPDADRPEPPNYPRGKGRWHMERIAERLEAMGCVPRFLNWTGAPAKGDATDYFAAGRSAAALEELIGDAHVPPADEWSEEASTGMTQAQIICLADVKAEPLRWLWRDRIPLGKLTVLDGDPGLGKSLLTTDLAARVSTGRRMPDDTAADFDGPTAVVLLSAEDGLAETVRPRLDAAGADVTRVCALTGIRSEHGEMLDVFLPVNLDAVRQAIHAHAARLVVIDPLMAYLDARVNAQRDQDIRRALRPFAALAEKTGAAVVVVRHLNKAPGGQALYRGGGSIGIIGAARSGLLVGADPDDPAHRRVLAVTKSNLAAPAPSLVYSLEVHPLYQVACVKWHGTSDLDANGLLMPRSDEEDGRGTVAEAKQFLKEELAGGAVSTKVVLADARRAGIAEHTLRRAQKALGVEAKKSGRPGTPGGWRWQLPAECHDHAKDGHVRQDDSQLQGAGHLRPKAGEKPAADAGSREDGHHADVGNVEGGGGDLQRVRYAQATARAFDAGACV